MPQLLKWQELEYAQVSNEQERYHAAIALLWERKDLVLEGNDASSTS
jgi:hypothetical protein